MVSEYTIEELCSKITDGSHSSPKAYEDGKPMLSVKDMKDFGFDYGNCKIISDDDYEKLVRSGCRPEINDILIAKDGSVMKHVFRVKNEINAVLLSSIAILRPNTQLIYPQYLVYQLLNPAMKSYILNNYKSGTGVPRIVLKDFKKIQLSIPSLPTQKKIAHILSTLDDKIELNRKMNQTLEAMAQALFKSWFVDFDPVHVKAKSAVRNEKVPLGYQSEEELEAGAKELGLSKEVLELFPSAFVESEMGMIPLGWEVVRFKELIGKYIDNRGKTPPHQEYGIPLLEVKNLPKEVLTPGYPVQKYVTEETYDTWFRSHLEADDTLISTVGTIGLTNIVPPNSKFTIAQNVLGLRANTNYLEKKYLYYMMKSRKFLNDIDARLVTTVQLSIKRKDLETIDCLVPSIDIQKKFVSMVTPMLEKMQSNEIIKLQETRDILLPKLLSGELDVSEIEI